jgi:methylmalonyl-CoA mutase
MNDAADLPLAAEFPHATRAQWLKLVEGVLRGAPFEKKLIGRTYDGISIEPLYDRDTAARPIAGRAPGTPWQVIQRVDHPDPAVANAEALHDLENGATGLSLVFAGSSAAYGYGLDPSPGPLERVLEGVYLDGAALELQLSAHAREVPRHLAALVKRRGIAPETTEIRFGLNPIGGLAATGRLPLPWSELSKYLAALVRELAGQGFKGPFAVADGRVVHSAGGSEAQELAFALAAAVTYLRALEAGGFALDDARGALFFRLAADADQFLTIAKFRALRILWTRIEEACGLAPKPVFVAAETAWRMLTNRAPAVNMLRATMATFSAAIAGADAIAVLPHTLSAGLPDRFARRVARNTQLILLEESNLAKVADPAAGSGGMEALTRQIADAAWRLFQEIERAGGLLAALENGSIQRQVAAVRAERERAVAHGKDALTGTSEFPQLDEPAVSVLDVAKVVVSPPESAAVKTEPLSAMRLAEPFERLRGASDRMLSQTGSRPKVFLATVGSPADFTTRARFAQNFFAAGGIEAVTNEAVRAADEMSAAFKASGAKIACLCSSDELYDKQGREAAQALKTTRAAHLYLAGRPKNADALTAAGVKTFIFAGCDALAILKAAHDILGSDRRAT